MIKRLGHVNLVTHDLDQATHFYCDILGLEKAFEFYRNDALFGFYLKTGELTFIEIFLQTEDVNTQNLVIRHLCLEVEDLDSAIETIRSRGWEITDKKRGSDQSWQAWITDPSGVRIELMQYTEESSQYTGNNCIANW